jgi:hypothetical protein
LSPGGIGCPETIDAVGVVKNSYRGGFSQ